MTKLNRLMASKNHPRYREPRPRSTPTVVMDKTTPMVVPPILGRWDVVMLSPAANDGTLSRIDAAGFHVWRPRAVVQVSAATLGRAAWVNRPLWPRYAFLGWAKGCPALEDVPYIGPVRVIGQIDGQVVCDVASREWRGEYDLRNRHPKPKTFTTGTRVRTVDDLMEGIVLRSEGERVILLQQFLGADREIETSVSRIKEVT